MFWEGMPALFPFTTVNPPTATTAFDGQCSDICYLLQTVCPSEIYVWDIKMASTQLKYSVPGSEMQQPTWRYLFRTCSPAAPTVGKTLLYPLIGVISGLLMSAVQDTTLTPGTTE